MESREIVKAENLDDILRAFQPEPLKENDLQKFYCDKTMVIRTGDKWVSHMDDLFDACITPMGGNAHLLLGHRGCGKSTELYRLKKRLEDESYPVWLIDADADINLLQADCWDIMVNITEGLCRIAAEKDIPIPDDTLIAVFNYLKKDTEKTEETVNSTTDSTKVGMDIKAPPLINSILNFFVSFKKELKANTETRIFIKETMKKRASEWLTYILEISDRVVQGLDGKQPVIIFENLDKLQPPKLALDIFHYQVLAQIPFPIIYTFPISLCYDPGFVSIKAFYKRYTLPMVKVSNIDKSECTEGIDVIHEIVKLRANEKLFDKDALNILIKKTGGSLRDLFECIICAARRARRRGIDKIELEDARSALDELRSDLTRLISIADYDRLKHIYNSPAYKEQIESTPFLLEKTNSLVILEYNGKRWHDLHPLIAEFLIEQGIIDDSD